MYSKKKKIIFMKLKLYMRQFQEYSCIKHYVCISKDIFTDSNPISRLHMDRLPASRYGVIKFPYRECTATKMMLVNAYIIKECCISKFKFMEFVILFHTIFIFVNFVVLV